jgi:hypothetical protein
MLEWLILPGLVLIVVLSIVTARPKAGRTGRRRDGEDA